jgi:hypothetical protein
MGTLTAASTLAQVEASYDNNASYAEDNSPTKAKAFVTACRFLLRRLPAEGDAGEPPVARGEPETMQAELDG